MRTYKERTERIEKAVKKERKRRTRAIAISATSCVLAFFVAFNLVLFVPYTTGEFDLGKYEGSEYYSVIEKLAPLTYPAPVKKNNFDRWNLDRIFSGGLKYDSDMAPGNAGAAPDSDRPNNEAAGGKYEEVTNNQVDGVIEGDLFKRSSDTLFYLTTTESYRPDEGSLWDAGKYILRAYSIAGEDSELISEVDVTPGGEFGLYYAGYEARREMFLSEDCKTVTVLTPCYLFRLRTQFTAIITVDVSNPHTMSVTGVQFVAGSYVSSRMQNGTLLVINNYSVYARPDFTNEFAFLPSYGTAEDLRPLPVENIYLPENATRANYTVLATINTASGELIDAEALLSFSDEAYVSTNNIYVTNSYVEREDYTYIAAYDGETHVSTTYGINMTEITRISYEGGMLAVEASQTVEGTVNDRYSMDEFEGTFRVFTTAPSVPAAREDVTWGYRWLGTSANLYVLNAETMEQIASVERFAPEGESVMSARFNGNTAYVCTAVILTMTDPVFAFDLSDLKHITYKDTGTIPGYSLSLVTFMNDTLLGIGFSGTWSWSDLKIEIYGETADMVESIASVEVPYVSFSDDFKAYFIDREQGLVGLGVYDSSMIVNDYYGGYAYILFRFDGYDLAEVLHIDMGAWDYGYLGKSRYNGMRAFYQDGWFYVVDNGGLNVSYIG